MNQSIFAPIIIISLLFQFPTSILAEELHTKKSIEGWTVQVNNRLLDREKELGQQVLRLLEIKLYEVKRVLPDRPLKKLQNVVIWVDVDSIDFPGGVYHPSKEWLAKHGFNPKMAKCIQLGNAKNFFTWSLDQPSMILHELAHAYHHQVLGYNNKEIKQAYQNAVASKKYESVLRYNGKNERAYALNNDQEYFAELTEAFFGVNDFFPFVRAEVHKHDPEMAALLKQLWDVPN